MGRAPRGSFLPPLIRYGGSGTSSGGGGARNGAGGTGNDASYSTGIQNVPLKQKVRQWSFDQMGTEGDPGGGA